MFHDKKLALLCVIVSGSSTVVMKHVLIIGQRYVFNFRKVRDNSRNVVVWRRFKRMQNICATYLPSLLIEKRSNKFYRVK